VYRLQKHHSQVFTPKKPSITSNQESFRLNYLSDFISNQVEQNIQINHSIGQVIQMVNTNHQVQDNKMDQIIKENQFQKEKSEVFLEKVESHEKTAENILLSIEKISNHHDQLNQSIKNEQLLNQAILDQLSFQDTQLRNTNNQLENYVTLANQLSEQLISQEKLLIEMEQKLQVQDIYHQTVMKKLDNQDAVNEKILRQIDHLRSVVYESVSEVIDKLEKSYHATTDYFNGILNKTGFMKPFLLTRKPKEDKKAEKEII
jgi:predicted metal-binding transcription factor (methanogenesis marker protein 9)